MSLPKYLYKYERFNTYSLSNLKSQQIWFSAPKDFNDPFEFLIKLKPHSERDYITLFSRWKGKQALTKEEFAFFKKKVDKNTKEIFDEQKQNILNNKGVCCFSEKNDDILMWSHYSDSHKGFCLEFDTNYEPFSGALKIDYSQDIPTIDPLLILDAKDKITKESREELMKMITTKFKCWEYEKEWRIFHERNNQRFGYLAQSLTGIYFGSKMKKVQIEILALIIQGNQGQNPYTKFYKVSRDENRFKVNFEEKIYTPPYKVLERTPRGEQPGHLFHAPVIVGVIWGGDKRHMVARVLGFLKGSGSRSHHRCVNSVMTASRLLLSNRLLPPNLKVPPKQLKFM